MSRGLACEGGSAGEVIEKVMANLKGQEEVQAYSFQDYNNAILFIVDAFRGNNDFGLGLNSVIAVCNRTDQKFDAMITLEGNGEW